MLARERLKAFRESQELSLSAMARLLGVHVSYVGKVERGERQPAGAKFMQALELLSADWEHGPIRTEEWLAAPAANGAGASGAESMP